MLCGPGVLLIRVCAVCPGVLLIPVCPVCPGVLRNSSSESVSREPMSQQSTSSSVHQRLTLDTDVSSLAVQSLHCLCHVFSWTPLDTAATQAPPSLLSKLFELVNCGCHAGSAAEMVLGEAAMCCVNELLTKNQVPTAQCQQFVLALFTHTFSLLRSLTHLDLSNELRQQIAVTVRFDQLTNTYDSLVVSHSLSLSLSSK